VNLLKQVGVLLDALGQGGVLGQQTLEVVGVLLGVNGDLRRDGIGPRSAGQTNAASRSLRLAISEGIGFRVAPFLEAGWFPASFARTALKAGERMAIPDVTGQSGPELEGAEMGFLIVTGLIGLVPALIAKNRARRCLPFKIVVTARPHDGGLEDRPVGEADRLATIWASKETASPISSQVVRRPGEREKQNGHHQPRSGNKVSVRPNAAPPSGQIDRAAS